MFGWKYVLYVILVYREQIIVKCGGIVPHMIHLLSAKVYKKNTLSEITQKGYKSIKKVGCYNRSVINLRVESACMICKYA